MIAGLLYNRAMRIWARFSLWFFPLAILAVFWAAIMSGIGVVQAVLACAAGFLGWTLIEYLAHRFFFHWTPRQVRLRRFLQGLHLRHHGDPRNPDRLLVKPPFSLGISLILALLLAVALPNWELVACALGGLWAGFFVYELTHFRIHLSQSSGRILMGQRRRHFVHHFVDDTKWFGVTTGLWDHLLGTTGRWLTPEAESRSEVGE